MSRLTRRRLGALPVLAAAALAAPASSSAATTVELHTTITGFDSSTMRSGDAGDVNGDGRADLLIRRHNTTCPEQGWIVFGAAAGGTISLDALGTRGLTITAPAGQCVEPVRLGDVNGDGKDDVGLKPFEETSSIAETPARVVFGRTAGGAVAAGSLGTAGLTLTAGGGVTLQGMNRAGDVNGDGKADIGLAGKLVLPGQAAARPAAGAVFGRAAGGTLAVSSAPGLLAARGGAPPAPSQGVAGIWPVGDVNGDGKADVLVDVTAGPPNRQLIYGRATAGVVDVAALGTGGVHVTGEADLEGELGDVNGDKLTDYVTTSWADEQARSHAMLSSRAGAVLPLSDPAARALTLRASLGTVAAQYGYWADSSPAGTGDLNGDGRGEIAVSATYPVVSSDSEHLAPQRLVLRLNYLVAGATASRLIDLRIAGSWGIRLDAIPDGFELAGGLKFTGTGPGEVTAVSPAQLRLYSIVDRPAPAADKTAPALSNVRFGNARIHGSCGFICPTSDPAETSLNFAVNERAYIEVSFRREGSSATTVAKGSVPPGAGQFRVYGQPGWLGGNPLQAGRWIATFVATDMAGNKSAPVSTSLRVL